MLRRILRKMNLLAAGLRGEAMVRPLNLFIVPRTLEPGSSAGFLFYGRDVREILAGCGGLLTRCMARGARCSLMTTEALSARERSAAVKLGIDPDSVLDWKDDSVDLPPGDLLHFFPFPPDRDEREKIERRARESRGESYFYDSRFLILPEYTVCIDDFIEVKTRALEFFPPEGEPRASRAAAAYRSASIGRGSGWYESFISYKTVRRILSRVGEG